jgi:probable HAF family extracellular repeat protein
MTKQKWLVALLVGSSIGCVCDAQWSSAQSPSGLSYRLQLLPNTGSPFAGGLSNPLSINNQEWVSGAINPPSDLIGHPGLWRRTGNQTWQLTDLGTLGGTNAEVDTPNKNEIGWLAARSDIAAIDPNAENFCGWVCTTPSCPPTNHICRGFLWRAETKTMLALPPITPIRRCETQHNLGCSSAATAANNNHQIAGYAENGVMGQNCAAPQVFLYEGVVWGLNASGAPFIQRTLPPVTGDAVSQAFGMNDAGIVVGGSGGCGPPNILPASPPMRAVLWKDGGNPRVLGTLGGSQAIAYEINETGQVVGQSFLRGDTVVHIFLWQEGMPMKDLGSLLPDDTGVGVQSINNLGEVSAGRAGRASR